LPQGSMALVSRMRHGTSKVACTTINYLSLTSVFIPNC
jgi:hypothetical protein